MAREFTNDSRSVDEVPLTFNEIKSMVRGLVRYPNVFKSAMLIGFGAEHLNGRGEGALRVFIDVYSMLHVRHNGTVTKDMLLTEIMSMAENNLLPLNQQDADFLFGDDGEGFIDHAFDTPVRELTKEELRAERQYIESILRRFLNARMVKQQLQRLMNAGDENTSPLEFSALLTDFNKKAQAVRFLGNEAVNAAEMPTEGGTILLPPPPVPTGIAWIDNYIGGFREGDLIGLLGPYSGGKTTMLSTIAVRMAQRYAASEPDKLAVYICYEDGAQKLNYTLYSAAAHIERDAFINKTQEQFWAELSTSDNLKPYERELPINANAEVLLGERERWRAVQSWFNENFTFLDFSANPDTGGRGNGGVPEIVSMLSNLCERTGKKIGFLGLDYAGPLLNRFLAQTASTKYQEQIWRPLQMLPDELKTNIAIPFGCTIFLAHQLAQGDVKNIPAYRHVSHADAQGSKAFAENLHACLCLNKPDPDCFVSTIHWSKIRFGRPASPFGLVKINDKVVDVRSVDDEYYINDLAKKIMLKGELGPTSHSTAVVAPGATTGRRRVMPVVDTFGQDLLS